MENQIKIMVVDDEVGICKNVEKILTKNNYSVVHTQSASQALEMMKDGTFSLLISDIVMPEMNGLELLNHVSKEVPGIKTVMMTGYASTNTAVKAIRLGALDYIPKPFTPDELRTTVSNALLGKYDEISISDEERDTIEVMDINLDFGSDAASNLIEPETKTLLDEIVETPQFHCEVGDMVCDVMEKLGATCKTGLKKEYCPKLKALAKKQAKNRAQFNPKTMIGIDQPFDYDEVVAITGPEYVRNLDRDGFAFLPYEDLKKVDLNKFDTKKEKTTVAPAKDAAKELPQFHCEVGDMVCDVMEKLGATCKTGLKKKYCPKLKALAKKQAKKSAVFNPKTMIGIDQPFDYDEVVAITGPEYVQHLDRDGFSFLPYEELKKVDVNKYSAKAKNILVVDDEVSVNNNIRKILGKKGFEVDQAMSKEDALEMINQQTYKLVLLDLRMPGVSGLELLKAISQVQPHARVIIITGYASIETAIETARIGAVDYLPKPFTPDELRNVAERAYTLAA